LFFANSHLPEAAHYSENNFFYYYTGIADPGAVLFMDVEKNIAVLFEPRQEKRTAQVYGPNLLSLPKDEQAKLGFQTGSPITQLRGALVYFLSTHSGADLMGTAKSGPLCWHGYARREQ
jgi:hypothetical protein